MTNENNLPKNRQPSNLGLGVATDLEFFATSQEVLDPRPITKTKQLSKLRLPAQVREGNWESDSDYFRQP